MKSDYSGELESEVIEIGEYEESIMLKPFSLQEKEKEESKAVIKRHTATWKDNYRAWKNKEATKKAKFTELRRERIKRYKAQLAISKDPTEIKVITKALEEERNKYYVPTSPPFPASDVSVLTQVEYLAKEEYIPKPYDIESLVQLIEMNQRLKSSVLIYARNSVGLGLKYRPTKGRNVADFTEDELKAYDEQGRKLVDWYNSRVEQGKHFTQVASAVLYGKSGVGEGYFEVVDTRGGRIAMIKAKSPVFVWEGNARDRFIEVRNGRKRYLKPFSDKKMRDSETFKPTGNVNKSASRVIPFREYNLLNDIYGVCNWTGSIPQIIGHRYANERNANLLNNDGVPRMAITVAGGAVDKSTLREMKKFFASKSKGRQNAGRVLLMTINSKNQLNPNSKPPTVKFEPLTVGVTDDASFMKYQVGGEESIREAFRLALTFYGTGGDANRASAYTLRDQVVRTVFAPEAAYMEDLCNDTFTYEWAFRLRT